MLRPHRARSAVTSIVTHAIAAALGGVLVLAVGLVTQPRGDAPARPESMTCVEPRPIDRTPSPTPACPDPPPAPPAISQSDARTMLLELQKASSDAALAELGGMPLSWSSVSAVPEGVHPDRFEATVEGIAAELGVPTPEVDCSEFPCVVIAPDAWTAEQLSTFRERIQHEVGIDDPQLFGLDHGATRVVGVYSGAHATPELLSRLWFRTREHRRDAELTTEDGDAR